MNRDELDKLGHVLDPIVKEISALDVEVRLQLDGSSNQRPEAPFARIRRFGMTFEKRSNHLLGGSFTSEVFHARSKYLASLIDRCPCSCPIQCDRRLLCGPSVSDSSIAL
jgi:hypothetical protein